MLLQQENMLYEAFFQRNAHYYLEKLEQEKNGRKYTFNIYAFLFGFFWFLYRKMYVAAFLLLSFLLIEGIAESYFLQFVADDMTVNIISWGINLIVWTLTGFMANHFYLKKASAVVNKINNEILPEKDVLQYLKKKGGTSYIFLLPIILLALAFFIYNNYGLDG